MLARDGGDVTVKFHELDISQKGSIEVFRDMLVREHPEGVDAVVNNAGEFERVDKWVNWVLLKYINEHYVEGIVDVTMTAVIALGTKE